MKVTSLKYKLFSDNIFIFDCYTLEEAEKKSKKYNNTKIILDKKEFNDFIEYNEWIKKNPFTRKSRK